ncbi:MAG: 2-dehydro-3-deoxy-phosphogluconate aldolase [Microbacteriaceae bacterium]|nr:2-dehydro-3-deoxy-phosphogluconate aldolase [Microbacteriaceae bacterium]HEV7957547.1 bifunctional 4-hydroxy-2-oxoglutarate aldolase/2-dehydro-3-deoxy-phosphogluconate aldolase [Marisediminicola sp.]
MQNPLDAIAEDRCVAVVRAAEIPDAAALAAALAAGGIRGVELTFTTPGVLELIASAVEADTGAVVGAGTVLDRFQALDAIAAGAEFLVTPGLSEGVASAAAENGIPLIMGTYTASEVMRALDLGVAAVKIFPADAAGAGYLKSLRGPFPDLRVMASGGISESNAADYLAAGAFCVAAGSSVVPASGVESGQWQDITTRARRFVASFDS